MLASVRGISFQFRCIGVGVGEGGISFQFRCIGVGVGEEVFRFNFVALVYASVKGYVVSILLPWC